MSTQLNEVEDKKKYYSNSQNLIWSVIALVTLVKLSLACSAENVLYKSTDFDVHRNWMSITRHLPVREWYFDDNDGKTVHTLDYPPLFAWFEYSIANFPLMDYLLENEYLDERCLDRLGDDDNETSHSCVVFQRLTVVLGDIVFLLGAYVASKNVSFVMHPDDHVAATKVNITVLLLLVTNAGLIILDHIHFQYNGMMLGLLLASIGFMIEGKVIPSALFYCLLISMKHLYITLGPLYFIFLLRSHCFDWIKVTGRSKYVRSFNIVNFAHLGAFTLSVLVFPFLPFLAADNSMQQLIQIKSRLFPFARGLCHDYWAGNIWALYLFIDKILRFVSRKLPFVQVQLPDVSPFSCAIILFIGLLPGIICAWIHASKGKRIVDKEMFFVNAVVYSGFASFMLGYHTHEKAIMTAIIPLTLISTQSHSHAMLFIRTMCIGHFGLLPLLYRPNEFFLKSFLFVFNLILSYNQLKRRFSRGKDGRILRLSWADKTVGLILFIVYLFGEIIHPIYLRPMGILEFFPLMIHSVVCAAGLLLCWIHSFVLMLNAT